MAVEEQKSGDGNRNRMTSLEDRYRVRPVTCVDDVQATGSECP